MRKIDTLLNFVSVSYALATIENTLSIILLCLNIAWICYNIGLTIYKKVKNKEQITQQDFNQITNDLTQLQNTIKEVNDNVNKK